MSADQPSTAAPTLLPLTAEGGAEMKTWTIAADGVMRCQWWRQVGWHGQTGRVYALTDNPRATEPGGWYPLWHLIENEEPPAPEAPDAT